MLQPIFVVMKKMNQEFERGTDRISIQLQHCVFSFCMCACKPEPAGARAGFGVFFLLH